MTNSQGSARATSDAAVAADSGSNSAGPALPQDSFVTASGAAPSRPVQRSSHSAVGAAQPGAAHLTGDAILAGIPATSNHDGVGRDGTGRDGFGSNALPPPTAASPSLSQPSTDPFQSLDSPSAPGAPMWTHSTAHQAEAGFEDPALGWVGVRADLSGGAVHASLLPGSEQAAQELGRHMDGLNTYLAEQHTAVDSLVMAAPTGRAAAEHGLEHGLGQGMQQELRQGAGQQPGQQPGQGAQPGQPGSQQGSPASGRGATGATAQSFGSSTVPAVPPGFTEARGATVDGSSTEMGADRHISLVA